MKRFLFIGHDAGRTGAPIVLLHYLRWVKDHMPDWHCDLLLIRGGALEAEYREVAEVFVLPSEPKRTIARRGIKFFKNRLRI
jgi:hypothetical protein